MRYEHCSGHTMARITRFLKGRRAGAGKAVRPMFRSLMTSRRFAPLFWCQFFAAFSDNFLKNALAFLILFKLGTAGGEVLVTLGSAVFIAPFFLLSGLGGQLADRFDKGMIAEKLK